MHVDMLIGKKDWYGDVKMSQVNVVRKSFDSTFDSKECIMRHRKWWCCGRSLPEIYSRNYSSDPLFWGSPTH